MINLIESDEPATWRNGVHVFDQRSIAAINATIATNQTVDGLRALLVQGEPGTGKSQLAKAAAVRLNRRYIEHVVTGRTRARDLLYQFDDIGRFGEAQILGAMQGEEQTIREQLDPKRFTHPGPLWWAYDWASAQEQERESARMHDATSPTALTDDQPPIENGVVVLIDEIDKAEPDVANDLLGPIGSGEFRTGDGTLVRRHSHIAKPLVIFTTNQERALPDAFTRRCAVLELSVPDVTTGTGADDYRNYLMRCADAHFARQGLRDATSDTLREVMSSAADLLVGDRGTAIRERQSPYPGLAEYLDLLRAVTATAPGDGDAQLRLLEVYRQYFYRKHPGGAAD